MVFNSVNFFIFLPIVITLFLLTPDRFRWLVLLIASLVFYSALSAPHLLGVVTFVALGTYLAGQAMARQSQEAGKLRMMWMGIGLNLLVLFLMKYLAFASQGVNRILHAVSLDFSLPVSPLLVSIGVSYFIFQAISYLVDIYLEVTEPEPHFGHFFLYLAFFPKLLQGPIERAGDLLPQLKAKYEFNYENTRSGLILIAWGLFKKIAIADRLTLFVNSVYGNVHGYGGPSLLLATYMFALQIYFDFSAYTDMAIGIGRLFNIELTQNFDRPYFAKSISDFWRRWHISFSRWILDYIFKPLQMRWRDWKVQGTALALVVTFLASGLWHGATLGYIAWGLLHGLYMAVALYWKPYQKKLYKQIGMEKSPVKDAFQIFVTFNLVSLAWIFFRANSLGDALYVCHNIFRLTSGAGAAGGLYNFLRVNFGGLGITKADMIVLFLSLSAVAVVAMTRLAANRFERLTAAPALLRWPFYLALAFSIVCLTKTVDIPFLYFQY